MNSGQIKRIITSLTGFLPVEKALPANEHRFIFPFWHSVSDEPLLHLSKLYCVSSVPEFERDMDFLLNNYQPAVVEDVVNHAVSARKNDRKLFFPTFDDGLAECYHVIAPILKRKRIQAAFFINPSFVDNKTLFHRHKASLILNIISKKPSGMKDAESLLLQRAGKSNLSQFLHQATFNDHQLLDELADIFELDFDQFLIHNQPYMTLGQIKELQDDGFLIGAHGMDHREFFLSSEEKMIAQITASMEFLVQEINPPIKSFAFPFTDFKVPNIVFEKVIQSNLWDLSFGTAGMKDEVMPRHLQRIPMESGINMQGKKVIRSEYIWYYLKSVFGKNKVRR